MQSRLIRTCTTRTLPSRDRADRDKEVVRTLFRKQSVFSALLQDAGRTLFSLPEAVCPQFVSSGSSAYIVLYFRKGGGGGAFLVLYSRRRSVLGSSVHETTVLSSGCCPDLVDLIQDVFRSRFIGSASGPHFVHQLRKAELASGTAYGRFNSSPD